MPYDPAWRLTFDALRQPIAAALGDLAIAIEHVGSTAVPGLVAKPIIDIDVIVSPDRADEAIERLGGLGYRHQGDLGIPGREAFRSPEDTPDHHLYVCPQGSHEYVRHRQFRDHLRSDAAARRAYAELKLTAARAAGTDRDAYTRMKSDFIERALRS
ncbi:MAG: GrpB family protein [Chloroflexota bacterium]|nr:GrpB family protein [Chloroflexota bacterium]